MTWFSVRFLTRFMAALAAMGAAAGIAGTAQAADKIYVGDVTAANVRVVDSATNTVMATIPLAVGSVAFQIVVPPVASPFVYVAELGNGTIAVIDSRTMQVFTRITVGTATPVFMVCSLDGRWLFVCDEVVPTVFVIDAKKFIQTAAISLAGQGSDLVSSIAMDPSGTSLWVLSGFSGGGTSASLHNIRVPKKGNPSLVGAPFPKILPAIFDGTNVLPQFMAVSSKNVYMGDFFNATDANTPGDTLVIFDKRIGTMKTLTLTTGGANGALPSIVCPRNGTRLFITQPGLGQIQVVNTQRNTLAGTIEFGAAAGGPGMAPSWLDVRSGAQYAWVTDTAGATISRVNLGNGGFPFQDPNQDGISPDPIAVAGAFFLAARPEFPGKGALPETRTDTRLAGLVPGFDGIDALRSILDPPADPVESDESPAAPAGNGTGVLFAGTAALAMAGLALTRLGRAA